MSFVRRTVLAAALGGSLLSPRAASAQGASAAAPSPPGWKWSLDRPARLLNSGKYEPSDSLFEFAHMAPGWHITMGPGAALYHPGERAEGRFVVTGEMVLFPNASNEEYGVFVGGQDLENAASKQWYTLVVRRVGSVAVMHRAGVETHMVMPWTKHAAVKARPDGNSVTNVVQIRAEPDSVRFFVNGERIMALSRADVDVDGPFGFRVGAGVNLHATNLDLTRRLAPHPAQRR
jgi:hypothetical protein